MNHDKLKSIFIKSISSLLLLEARMIFISSIHRLRKRFFCCCLFFTTHRKLLFEEVSRRFAFSFGEIYIFFREINCFSYLFFMLHRSRFDLALGFKVLERIPRTGKKGKLETIMRRMNEEDFNQLLSAQLKRKKQLSSG